MKQLSIVFLLFLCSFGSLKGQEPYILPLQERASLQDQWLEERLQQVLPSLMERSGIDMWVIAAREYNEDPVIETMLPANWMAARRRTVLLVYNPGKGKALETLAVARYDVGKSFKKAWDPEKQPNQWKRVAELIGERQPQKIGVNTSATFALADGLTHSEYLGLQEALPAACRDKIVSAEPLAIGWLETRTPAEMEAYAHIMGIAHQIIAEGFSEQHIQPGVTTTEELMWWFREKVAVLKLDAWFHPTVSLQRADPESFDHLRSFSSRPDGDIIQAGDLLHVDFGFTYLGLNTDTQQHAYVLKPGEREAPQALQKAFAQGNRLQEVLTQEFKTGRTGNEILKSALEKAREEGIKATIYTHPIGYHGHAAGPTIGMWDQQGGVAGAGDYPLYANTAYSIELNAAVEVPEWQKEIRIMLEEDAFFDGQEVRYIGGRQRELLLIPRKQDHLR